MRPTGRRLAATAALALATAATAPAALGPRYGGEIRVAADALPPRFEPGSAQGMATRLVAALAHERLVDVGREALPSPGLAESWTSAASGLEWTLRLREGATFHDGSPITTDDVLRSLRRFLRSTAPAAERLAETLEGGSAFRSGASDALPGIAGSGRDVVLHLRAPSAVVLSTLASPAAAVTGARGAGAGPFVPTTPSPIRGRAAFAAFAGHFRGRPFLDSVALESIPGAAARDLAHAHGPGRADLVASIEGGAPAATLILVLDPRQPPLDRVDVRRAVAAAMDGGDLVRHFIPSGTPTHLLLSVGLAAAPAETRVAARPAAVRRPVTIAVSTDVPEAVSQRVVAYLGTAGLQGQARGASPEDVWAVPAALRLVLFTPEVADPVLALDELALRAPFADDEDGRELRGHAAAELDRETREAFVGRAEAKLRETWALVPLASVPAGFRTRPGVHGVAVDTAGRIRLEDAWTEP